MTANIVRMRTKEYLRPDRSASKRYEELSPVPKARWG